MSIQPAQLLEVAFLVMLLVIAIGIVRVLNLFAAAMLTGVYSLISAVWFLVLDAPDVAFTEAAVGGGASTILILAALLLTESEARAFPVRRRAVPLAVTVAAGALLLYAVPDLPLYGAADSPANAGIGLEYLERTTADTHVPNVVTAVLASYRGFDTLGETTVIFTAAVAVLLLLGGGFRGRQDDVTAGDRRE